MNLQEVQKKIEGIQATHTAQLEEVTGQLQAASERSAQAQKEAAAAYEKTDSRAYHKAQDMRREAEDAARMYKETLDKLQATPLVSADEYKEAEAAIRDAANEKRGNILEVLTRHAEEILQLEKEYNDLATLCNGLLRGLQHDLAKDDACIEAANGKRIHVAHREKALDPFSVLEHAKASLEKVFGDYYNSQRPALSWAGRGAK